MVRLNSGLGVDNTILGNIPIANNIISVIIVAHETRNALNSLP